MRYSQRQFKFHFLLIKIISQQAIARPTDDK